MEQFEDLVEENDELNEIPDEIEFIVKEIRETLLEFTNNQLKEIFHLESLAKSGSKQELIDRILQMERIALLLEISSCSSFISEKTF